MELQVPHSYHLCSAEQCRNMDSRTIEEFGIPSFTLMELAGTRAADFIQSRSTPNDSVLIVCGKGNNAGDGLVVARLLLQKNYTVHLYFCDGTEKLSTDTQKNFELVQKLKADKLTLLAELPDLDNYDIIIDAMLGTGLKNEVRSPYKEVIQQINNSTAEVYALDVPSGLDSSRGQILGSSIKTDYTLTFGAQKAGFYLNDGIEYSGKVILCDLPIPNNYREKAAALIDEDWVLEHHENSALRNHKYADGLLYVIAGSEGLTGAAILACRSAWEAGLGGVVLITPHGLLDIYEKNLIKIIKKPIGQTSDKSFTEAHVQSVLDLIKEKKGTVLIGPGLGRSKSTIAFIQGVLAQLTCNVVLDADALFALSKMDEWPKPTNSNWILTPHPGELSTLLASDISNDFDRLIQVSSKAKSEQLTILSKGYPGIVGTSDGDAYLTTYETRIFSRAGFGDVLAGKVSAYFLKTNHPNMACFLALLDGKYKSEEALEYTSPNQIDPEHLI
ncbi:NAD(P)H-hydrate epimerase [Balneola vulgaris]|uniref:NAD(P)H-hydrate epimerase n=1 Tax=Balneola vulgaris TaxID=287535 RepID=UPI000686D197|nr:NAD(P)H-hydrate epimerase [Balneola vulgaris]